MSILDTLRVTALELAVLREEAAQRSEAVKAKLVAFEATIAEEAALVKQTKDALAAKEAEVRALALVAHEQTDSKEPCGGITIVTLTEYLIDEDAVMAHAKLHADALPGLVEEKLNVAAVKKMAGAGLPLPGVVVKPVFGVRIASDLASKLQTQAAA